MRLILCSIALTSAGVGTLHDGMAKNNAEFGNMNDQGGSSLASLSAFAFPHENKRLRAQVREHLSQNGYGLQKPYNMLQEAI